MKWASPVNFSRTRPSMPSLSAAESGLLCPISMTRSGTWILKENGCHLNIMQRRTSIRTRLSTTSRVNNALTHFEAVTSLWISYSNEGMVSEHTLLLLKVDHLAYAKQWTDQRSARLSATSLLEFNDYWRIYNLKASQFCWILCIVSILIDKI